MTNYYEEFSNQLWTWVGRRKAVTQEKKTLHCDTLIGFRQWLCSFVRNCNWNLKNPGVKDIQYSIALHFMALLHSIA